MCPPPGRARALPWYQTPRIPFLNGLRSPLLYPPYMCHRSWSWARWLVERWRCAEIGPGLSPHRESPHSAYWLGKERQKERVPPALFLQAESSYPEIHSYPNTPETLTAGFWKWGTSTVFLSVLEFKFMPLTPLVRSSPWTAIEPDEQCLSPWENGINVTWETMKLPNSAVIRTDLHWNRRSEQTHVSLVSRSFQGFSLSES